MRQTPSPPHFPLFDAGFRAEFLAPIWHPLMRKWWFNPLRWTKHFLGRRYKKARKRNVHGHFGGERGIRTPGEITPTPDFESGAFDHSAISPGRLVYQKQGPLPGPGIAGSWSWGEVEGLAESIYPARFAQTGFAAALRCGPPPCPAASVFTLCPARSTPPIRPADSPCPVRPLPGADSTDNSNDSDLWNPSDRAARTGSAWHPAPLLQIYKPNQTSTRATWPVRSRMARVVGWSRARVSQVRRVPSARWAWTAGGPSRWARTGTWQRV